MPRSACATMCLVLVIGICLTLWLTWRVGELWALTLDMHLELPLRSEGHCKIPIHILLTSLVNIVQFLPFPELIPFRLTPQITNLLLPHSECGQLRSCMTHVLRALRNSPDLLLCTMDIFVKEPLLDWKVHICFCYLQMQYMCLNPLILLILVQCQETS